MSESIDNRVVDNSKLICRPTMENVLLKLNVKGGGHNYNVNPEKFA